MFCCLEPVSCRLAVATNCRLELQPVVTNIPKCDSEHRISHTGKKGFNLIALRTAKTLWSFGRSECNRVKCDVCNKVFALYDVLKGD